MTIVGRGNGGDGARRRRGRSTYLLPNAQSYAHLPRSHLTISSGYIGCCCCSGGCCCECLDAEAERAYNAGQVSARVTPWPPGNMLPSHTIHSFPARNDDVSGQGLLFAMHTDLNLSALSWALSSGGSGAIWVQILQPGGGFQLIVGVFLTNLLWL